MNAELSQADSSRAGAADGQGFVAGTLVHTSEGLKPIEQIKVGDLVLSKPESGEGEVAYKPVVRTVEVEDSETWFVAWWDPELVRERKEGKISYEELVRRGGRSFVITTPNHPFWVVESDEEYLRLGGAPHLNFGGRYPKTEWVRADRLAEGMKLLLASGGTVKVRSSLPVYKTDSQTSCWIDINDHSWGLRVDLSAGAIAPCVSLFNCIQSLSFEEGMVANPNPAYEDDYPFGARRDSWFRTTVYNFEVQDHHTCFVDTRGVWVHNAGTSRTSDDAETGALIGGDK